MKKINTSNKALVAWILICALVVFSVPPKAPAAAKTMVRVNSSTPVGCEWLCGLIIGFLLERAYQAMTDQNVPNKGVGGGGGDAF